MKAFRVVRNKIYEMPPRKLPNSVTTPAMAKYNIWIESSFVFTSLILSFVK